MELEKIYREYFSTVYCYMLSLSKDPAIAEEITQETFFRAMKKVDAFRGDCAVQTWLCQIAKNAYYNYLRKKSKSDSIDEHQIGLMREEESPEDKLVRKECSMQIHKILHRINEPYKEVFMLRVFGELSFKEIGDVFDKSDTWARVTYHRARNMIREALGNEY